MSSTIKAFQITKLDPAEDMLPIRAEWNELVSANQTNSIFQTWEWVYYHVVNSNHKPFIIIARDTNKKLVGVCPLLLRKTFLFKLIPVSILESVGSGDSDYLDFLTDTNEREAVIKAIIGWITASNFWNVVDLRSLTEPDIIRKNLKDARGKPKHKNKLMRDDICPYLMLDSNWNSAEDGLSCSLRKYLKRKTNKLTKDKTWRIQIVVNADRMDGLMQDFMSLHNQRLREKSILGLFEDESQKTIFSQITKAFAEKGWVQLIALEIDNKIAGVLYTFLFHNKLYYYQSGIDPQYQRYSLGYLLHFHAVKTAWEAKLTEYDFLKGGESYKRQWADKTRKVFRLIIYSNSAYRIIYSLLFLKERVLLGPLAQKLYLVYKTNRMPTPKNETTGFDPNE